MKNKLYILITFGLLAVLVTACGLVGSKPEVIKCTGTEHATTVKKGETKWVNGILHQQYIITYDQESNCPELTGVFTVDINFTDSRESMWGTFYFETAYYGGGTFEGTLHATNNYTIQANGFSAEATSYSATGSLRGLQLSFNASGPTSSPDLSFEASIQNLPKE